MSQEKSPKKSFHPTRSEMIEIHKQKGSRNGSDQFNGRIPEICDMSQ